MERKSNKYTKVPRYFGLRIYVISSLMYFFLVFPVASILLFRYVPDYMQRSRALAEADTTLSYKTTAPGPDSIYRPAYLPPPVQVFGQDSAGADQGAAQIQGETSLSEQVGGNQIGGSVELLARLLLASFIIGFAFNLPFKIYFRKIRRSAKPSEKLTLFCKRFLLKTPHINAAILMIAYGITILVMLYKLFIQGEMDELNRQFFLKFFFITLVSSTLTIMLVFFWQKHRVHIRYIEYLFSEEELKRRIFRIRRGRIRSRLWIASAMTTLIPLIIVLFYLLLSITSVKDLGISSISNEQREILMGRYMTINLEVTNEYLNNLFYVNAINSLLMLLGIGSGILVALIYLVLFVRWTTEDILRPVSELLSNMERAGRGELDSYSIVRTDDEIGELTEGFNKMSEQLQNYFTSLSDINKANSRFVPRQFLDFLGKESITDIMLGDQVQKEMTILFSDIRDFTSISEQMSPKQNFDYLNSYLGYMEPVIRMNNGFIDKFMGDSIMALFPEKAEDAINASIEMRIKLVEFNEVMDQFNKPIIRSGIGIHTGMLMLGVIGGEGRMDGTVISDAVNLSSRIEGLTKIYGSSIIITEDTLIRINDPSHYSFRFIDVVKVKGKKEAVYIFEIIDGDGEELKLLKIKTKEDYVKAMQSYKKRDFNNALGLLERITHVNPEDRVARLYINRCRYYIDKGVPENWDGVENIDYKF